MDIFTLNAVIEMLEARAKEAEAASAEISANMFSDASIATLAAHRYSACVEAHKALLAAKDMLAEELYQRDMEALREEQDL